MTPRKLITLSLAGLVATAGTLAVVSTAMMASAAAAPQGVLSGLPWVHGAYLDHNPGNIALFQTDTGKQLDAVEGFAALDDITNISWQAPGAAPVTSAGGKLILSVPLWASNKTVNTGSTASFGTLRNNLVAAGIANKTIIRLGWEMNIDFGHWSVTSSNRAAWVARFQEAVTALRANNSGIQVAFNPNEGASQSGRLANIWQLALDLKPYFEWVGIDFYNWDGSMNTASGWASRYGEAYGMQQWENWARTNGKGFSVPEWGGTSQNTASDDVFYTQQMIKRFAAMGGGETVNGIQYPGIPVFESVFSEPGFDYTPYWAGTIARFRLNTDSQTGTPRAAQLPVMRDAYKASLASIVVQPTPSVSSGSSDPTVSPIPTVSPTC